MPAMEDGSYQIGRYSSHEDSEHQPYGDPKWIRTPNNTLVRVMAWPSSPTMGVSAFFVDLGDDTFGGNYRHEFVFSETRNNFYARNSVPTANQQSAVDWLSDSIVSFMGDDGKIHVIFQEYDFRDNPSEIYQRVRWFVCSLAADGYSFSSIVEKPSLEISNVSNSDITQYTGSMNQFGLTPTGWTSPNGDAGCYISFTTRKSGEDGNACVLALFQDASSGTLKAGIKRLGDHLSTNYTQYVRGAALLNGELKNRNKSPDGVMPDLVIATTDGSFFNPVRTRETKYFRASFTELASSISVTEVDDQALFPDPPFQAFNIHPAAFVDVGSSSPKVDNYLVDEDADPYGQQPLYRWNSVQGSLNRIDNAPGFVLPTDSGYQNRMVVYPILALPDEPNPELRYWLLVGYSHRYWNLLRPTQSNDAAWELVDEVDLGDPGTFNHNWVYGHFPFMFRDDLPQPQWIQFYYQDSGADTWYLHRIRQAPVPPNAPAWVTPSATKDVEQSLVLDWSFSDSNTNPVDNQVEYTLYRKIGAGAVRYWNGSSWQASETSVATSATAVTFPAGWGNGDDDAHVYKVKTSDGVSFGDYSSDLTITPTITPTVVASVPNDPVLEDDDIVIDWTADVQDKFRATLLDSQNNIIEQSALLTSTARTYTFATQPVSLDRDQSYRVKVQPYWRGLQTVSNVVDFEIDLDPEAPTLDKSDTQTDGGDGSAGDPYILKTANALSFAIGRTDDADESSPHQMVLRAQVGAGAFKYWNGSSWQSTEVVIDQTTSSTYTGLGTNHWKADYATDDAAHVGAPTKYWVKNVDDEGQHGPYSAPIYVQASRRNSVNVTSPAAVWTNGRVVAVDWSNDNTPNGTADEADYSVSIQRKVYEYDQLGNETGFSWQNMATESGQSGRTHTFLSSAAHVVTDGEYRIALDQDNRHGTPSNVEYHEFTANLRRAAQSTIVGAGFIDAQGNSRLFIGDAAAPPVPSQPNTPGTAVLVAAANLATNLLNAVLLRGQPRGYTYYDVEVPHHATTAVIYLFGAGGAGAWGAPGGEVTIQNIPVTPGELLRVAAGGRGGAGTLPELNNRREYSGGGASWVQRTGNMRGDAGTLIAVAAGGGGGSSTGRRGGAGGASTGQKGEGAVSASDNDGGDGGSQTNDGRGLFNWQGEDPRSESSPIQRWSGGGGDGWRGGEAGENAPDVNASAGGGGGSNRIVAGTTVDNLRGTNSLDGSVMIVFPPDLPPEKPENLNPPSGQSQDALSGPSGALFEWTYFDLNGPTDPQTGWEFRREIGQGVYEYWNDTLKVWSPIPFSNGGAVTSIRFPAGTWQENIAYNWQVRVQDTGQGNEPGQWSLWSDPTVALEGDGTIDVGASNELEHALLDLVFNAVPYVPPAAFYIAAFITPSNDEGGTEQASGNRSTVVQWSPASGGVISNENEVTLTVDPSTTVVALGVYDAPVLGNFLVHVNLTTPISAGPLGQVYVFAPGDLVVQMR